MRGRILLNFFTGIAAWSIRVASIGSSKGELAVAKNSSSEQIVYSDRYLRIITSIYCVTVPTHLIVTGLSRSALLQEFAEIVPQLKSLKHVTRNIRII